MKDNLEQRLIRKGEELISGRWKDHEYLKKILSNVDGTIDDMPTGEYVIDFDIVVHKSGFLVLKPGTVLRFGSDYGLICAGRLDAKSLKNDLIQFTGNGWANITFLGDASAVSVLDYCIIENGRGREQVKVVDGIMTGFPGDQGGGGICIIDSSPKISNSIIRNNEFYSGGGIAIKGGDVQIIGCEIYGNTADLFGGGIVIDKASNANIRNCDIHHNKTQGWSSGGGGIYIDSSKLPDIQYNNIHNNESYSGAGIYLSNLSGGSFTMRKNTITQNIAKERGGGVVVPSDMTPFTLGSSKPNYQAEKIRDYNTVTGNIPDDLS